MVLTKTLTIEPTEMDTVLCIKQYILLVITSFILFLSLDLFWYWESCLKYYKDYNYTTIFILCICITGLVLRYLGNFCCQFTRHFKLIHCNQANDKCSLETY